MNIRWLRLPTAPRRSTLFKADHFDLVITDFEMPQMKGNELAARIKQISPSQPILMITAYAERLGGQPTTPLTPS